MDSTGSMGSWIKKAKENMRDVVKHVKTFFKCEVKVGFLGYRDILDDK